MLDTFESPQDGMRDAGDTRMWDAMKESDATAGPTGGEDPEDEIVGDDLVDDDDLDELDDHDDDLDVSRESCLKVCDDGANAPVKLQTGVDLTDPGLAPLVVTIWTTATPVVSVPSRFDILQAPIAGTPFRVRYSRLTL